MDPYTVGLPSHADYVLRVSLTQFTSSYTEEGRKEPPAEGNLDPMLPRGSYTIQATLQAPGGDASDVPAILAVETSAESSTSAINEALIALRFIVEGASARGGLHEETFADLRRVATRRLVARNGSPTTLWWAIDLAWSLRDRELQQAVDALASDTSVIVGRGITDPQLIEQTQRRAADRVAGLSPLPRP